MLVFVGLTFILCCACGVVLSASGVAVFDVLRQAAATTPARAPETFDQHVPVDDTSTPEPTPQVTRPPVEEVQRDTLEVLKAAVLPARDVPALACRLQAVCDIPRTVPSGPFAVGDKQTFNASNVDQNRNFKVDATLQYLTDHAYFWVEDGVSLNSRDMRNLADTFESQIYPTDRDYFGSEWTPGVDGDPRIHVLFAKNLGLSIAGFFSSADEYPPQAHEYSNAHEIFFLNADYPQLRRSFTYGILAHEFQHMIHWNQDLNEDVWLNEGLSELAAFLNGYDLAGYDYSFATDTDLQLTSWPHDFHDDTIPHYGAGFLFVDYFLDRFGKEANQALVREPANGLDGVDAVLRQIDATDALTGRPITADDFFLDWTIANYVHDSSVGDGRYVYNNYADAPEAFDTETFAECPAAGPQSRDVHQFGTDYIRITCPGHHTLHFAGSTELPLLSEGPYSGQYAFWGNRGDEADTSLQHEFDFTRVSGPIEMAYHTWYDIEDGYDFVYVEASTDGETWEILKTPSGDGSDPSGNAFGWAYSGSSDSWLEEKVDLSRFAGRKVWLRFEYITDDGATAEGFLLDDISIPAIGYSTDFESDDGGWQAAGFARVKNTLPQTFKVALITKGGQTHVQIVELTADQAADIPIDIGEFGVDEATLVVSGTTRFTTQRAAYTIDIE
jgi:immune inhibitor A